MKVFTYKNQPTDNVIPWRFSEAFDRAKRGGDRIDHGLSILQKLEEMGYGIAALTPEQEQHPDDIAVDRFAAAMKAKMAKQRAKGYGGWESESAYPTARLQQMLADHIAKGDPVDVGNFAMMVWNRGERTQAPTPQHATLPSVHDELQRATAKFPTWPTDPLHALAVVGEEFGELTKDVLQLTYEPGKTNAENVRKEAIQTAAMALRFVASLDAYIYKASEQHRQQAFDLPTPSEYD